MFLVLGSFTKRAQFPFSNWLPAAMAAPTPISSLVHSSTLVTAGVFLVIRFSSFFSEFYFIKIIMLVRGIITIIFAGIIALLEKDLKKVVALSTLRHLGLIITSCSIVGPLFGFFHLIIHAIFKALLFINIGYLIIRRNHNQDRRLLRLNSNYLTISVLFRLFSMIGFYFFNGFLSKDLIIFISLTYRYKNIVLIRLMCFGFCLTVSYSIRFFLRLFCYFKNIQISLRKSLFKRTFILLIICLISGDLTKRFILERYLFFHAEKISFFIPLIVIFVGLFLHKLSSFVQKVDFVESIFFLNFILGNYTVFIRNFLSSKINKECNNVVNVLLEKRYSNLNIQNFSNSLIYYFFFLILFILWIRFFIKLLSSYSL